MNAPFHVTCAIPRSGRTLNNFLQKLVDLGVPSEEIDSILQILSQSKSRSSLKLDEALDFLEEVRTKAPNCFSVYVDRKRFHRPYRLGFLGHDWQIGPYKLRVEGEEPHNGSSLIRLDEVDFTVVGLDELLSMTEYYLRDPSRVTKWGMYNYHLEKPTGIRIAGSAMLCSYNEVLQTEIQDIVGFFLISKVSERKHPLNLKTLSRFGQQVFVKGRYTGIVMAAYPKLNIVSVEDVEDAVYSNLFLENGLSGSISVNWSDETFRKMSTSIIVQGTLGKIICDATELKIYLNKSNSHEGLEQGWNIKYLTELTPPVWFILRGEEYSSQIDHFLKNAKNSTQNSVNSFREAAETNETLSKIRNDSETT